MNVFRLIVASITAACLLQAKPLFGQQYVPTAVAEAASGLEGGGGRAGSIARAPTRLRFGAEVHVDEFPKDNLAAAVLFDLEPQTALGFDARYVRIFEQNYAVGIGAVGYITPGMLVGPAATFEVRRPLGKAVWLTAGPEVNVFFLGTSLPDRTVLWQGLLHAGIRVDL